MSQRKRRRGGPPQDLEPYEGCPADAQIGLGPLAVGWLERGQDFPQGEVPAGFTEKLLTFCLEPHTVCHSFGQQRCPLCNQVPEVVEQDGQQTPAVSAEIRVIGQLDIFAAPVLIYHYVTAHNYRPPDVFIESVQRGPAAGSPAHRALIRTLQG